MKFKVLSWLLISSEFFSLHAFRISNQTSQTITVREFGNQQDNVNIMHAINPIEVPRGYEVDSDSRLDYGTFSSVIVTVYQQQYNLNDLKPESVITFQEDDVAFVSYTEEEILIQGESIIVDNKTSAKIKLSKFLDNKGQQLEILPVQLDAGGKVKLSNCIDQMKIKGINPYAQNNTSKFGKLRKSVSFPPHIINNVSELSILICTRDNKGKIVFERTLKPNK